MCKKYKKIYIENSQTWLHTHLYTVWIRMNIVLEFAESRYGVYVLSSVRADQSPPAHLLELLRTLLAVRRGQLAGRSGVVSQQREEGRERPVAAAQAEEQFGQLDANAGRSVIALVAQGEEHIWLAAVSAPTQQRNSG